MLTIGKKTILIYCCLFMCLIGLLSCTKQNDNNLSIAVNGYLVSIDFDGYIEDNIIECHYYIDNDYRLYECYTEGVNSDRINSPDVSISYTMVELSNEMKSLLADIIGRLDNQCISRLSSIIENPPLIFMKLSNGYSGAYVYGEPDNKAFSEIVDFCIDHSPYEIKCCNGLDYSSYTIPNEAFGEEKTPLFRRIK